MIEITTPQGRRISIGQIWQSNDNIVRGVEVMGFDFREGRFTGIGRTFVKVKDIVTRRAFTLSIDGFRTGPGGWSLMREAVAA